MSKTRRRSAVALLFARRQNGKFKFDAQTKNEYSFFSFCYSLDQLQFTNALPAASVARFNVPMKQQKATDNDSTTEMRHPKKKAHIYGPPERVTWFMESFLLSRNLILLFRRSPASIVDSSQCVPAADSGDRALTKNVIFRCLAPIRDYVMHVMRKSIWCDSFIAHRHTEARRNWDRKKKRNRRRIWKLHPYVTTADMRRTVTGLC